MGIWRFDTDLDPEFPIYTRGNIGEVFPDVITPLTFSLNSPRLEGGWRRLWTEDARILDPSERDFRITGIFGAYGFLNLSIVRRAADLSPGTSPEEIDHQFFAVGITIPPYEAPDEPGYEERKEQVARWVEAGLKDKPVAAVESDRMMALEIRRRSRELRPSATDISLVGNMRQVAHRIEIPFYDHIFTSGLSSVAFGALQRTLRERVGQPGEDLSRRAVSGLGEVDSAEPANRIAELAALSKAKYEAGFEEFMDLYGFRGANEWELAAPSWELVPSVVHEMVEKARGSPTKWSALEIRADATAEIRALLGDWEKREFWLEAAHYYVAARERTKTNCIVLVNEERLAANELGRRLADRALLQRPEQVFMLTIDELEEAIHSGAVPDDLEEREREFDELRRRIPPLVIFGEIPPLQEWMPKLEGGLPFEADELQGVAGSPGLATGRVRVVLDPYKSTTPAPGEILVAPITDPGWTPMFVPAAAVVVEVGGELSHAVIVARELGIPAVVAAFGACSALRDGDLVEVDGSTGRVKVLERA